MISSFEEGPPIDYKLLFERKDIVKCGSVTETTQPILSYEKCMELRNIGFDETNIPIDATL